MLALLVVLCVLGSIQGKGIIDSDTDTDPDVYLSDPICDTYGPHNQMFGKRRKGDSLLDTIRVKRDYRIRRGFYAKLWPGRYSLGNYLITAVYRKDHYDNGYGGCAKALIRAMDVTLIGQNWIFRGFDSTYEIYGFERKNRINLQGKKIQDF